jgi:hypothetical protein
MPDCKISMANQGKGSFLGWSKAPFWEFKTDGLCVLYAKDGDKSQENLIIAIKPILSGK